MISAASGPTMCAPSTASVVPSTISFMRVASERPDRVLRIGRNDDTYTSTGPATFPTASSSVRPHAAMGGCTKTAVATRS
jgi:hypothetical protein